MAARGIVNLARPGIRGGVLILSTVLVLGGAIAMAANVSDHLARTAVQEAVGATEAVIRADVDPLIFERGNVAAPTASTDVIDAELVRLVGSGDILRIKIWQPNGTVLASDLPALRGRTFAVGGELGEALAGSTATDFSDATAPENVFERGLANRFLEIYLPIRNSAGDVVAAYEIYQDAAPIEAQVDATRADVFLIAGGIALGLLVLLWLGFSGASRLLARQNRRLRQSEERFRSLVLASVDVNMVIAPDATITYQSAAAERVLGRGARDDLGRSLLTILHPDDQSWFGQLLADVRKVPGAQLSAEARALHGDGSWRHIEVVLTNLIADPAVEGIVVNYRDITTRKNLEDELRRQAFHDSLTGLANRGLFSDRLAHALTRTKRFHGALAVLFVDLDDFKTVNDSLGHAEGDQLLVSVAARLKRALRASDTIARMGGDEFAILVEDPDDVAAPRDVAQRLMAALEAPFPLAGKELFVRASIGISMTQSTRYSADELLRNADVAMYTAKANGKNRIEAFAPSMHEAALARLALKADLERALDRHEFRLLYQPIVDLRSGGMVGVEALVRWDHPDRGVVGPAEFIPVAEETGMIISLGRWVLAEACRQVVAWDSARRTRISVSVNVSGRQLQDPSFVTDVAAALSGTGLTPGRLTLELTESVLMKDADGTEAILADLKRLGVRLAIDDFGTGYSSLSYLRRFPIDELKIDRSFVAAMSDGPEEGAVVVSIVKLGETLHMNTVAEGIEDDDQLAGLQKLGADLGQGFYFARPLTPEALGDVLAATDVGLDPARAAAAG